MKKNALFCLAFSLLSLSVSAQHADTLKAQKGGFTTELNVNLFQGELSFSNALEQIKARCFLSDQWALRLAFSINNKKENKEVNQPYGTYAYLDKSTRKTFSYSLGAGFEYHFRGTRRLSPYIGVEAWLGRKKSSETIETKEQTIEIDGAWINSLNTSSMQFTEKGYFAGGLNLLAGFDFYVARNFYVGYEFVVLGYTSTKYDQIDMSYKKPNPSNPPPSTDDKESKLGPSLLNGIRIGYFF